MTIPYGEMTLAEAEDMVVKGFKSPIAENQNWMKVVLPFSCITTRKNYG